MKSIYLDYNATTPIDPEVAKEMQPYLTEYFGNPSSIHEYGVITKKAIEKARKQLAALINCKPNEIIFTGGGTESNNYAIKGSAFFLRNKGNHIISSSIEHPAVLEVCAYLETQGFEVSYLPVDEYGIISMEAVKKAIKPNTILISVMHANNEIGSVQSIAEIGKLAKLHNIRFHSDAAQSIGKVEVDVNTMGVDLLSIAAHKFYAPKGIGALYVKEGTKLEKFMHGANHEQNLRAGTENVLEIVGIGKAAEIAKTNFAANYEHSKRLRDRLYNNIITELPFAHRNGHTESCLPNTLSISFKSIEANTLLADMKGVAASAGAACHSEGIDISTTLSAIQLPIETAMGTIRFSTGKFLSSEDIDKASDIIVKSVKSLMPNTSIDLKQFAENTDEIRLTQYTHGLGCACKIRPQYLERVLQQLPRNFDPNVLVDNSSSDDAAVYKISDNQVIIQTVDFFTPMVDDAYDFGQIAAANSISDIYAMGAQPLFALNIVAFPDNRLPESVLQQILKGASDKASEAGISILGGHTIEDNEPKFGMAVTAISHPDNVVSNAGAKAGDIIFLTKAIGTGIVSTAIKRGLANQQSVNEAIALMKELNNKAADLLNKFSANACTDVTGFGLLGHLSEMLEASKLSANISLQNIPLIHDCKNLAIADCIPGGTQNNYAFTKNKVKYADNISDIDKMILNDAQTSGGLLICIDAKHKTEAINYAAQLGMQYFVEIGNVVEKLDYTIFVSS